MARTSKLGSPDSKLGDIVLGAQDSGGGGPQIYNRSVSDTLSLTDSGVPVDVSWAKAVSDVLSMSQAVTAHLVAVRSVSDTLALTSSVQTGGIFHESVSHVLSLTDSGAGGRFVSRSASDTLALTDTARPSIVNISVHDTLSMSDSVSYRGPIYVAIRHNLNLTQTGSDDQGVINQTVYDNIQLQDIAGRVYEVTVADTLSISDSGFRSNSGHDIITLTENVSVGKGGDVIDVLAITQSAINQAILNRSLSHTLGLQDGVAFYVVGSGINCLERSYAPFINTLSFGYTPPSTIPPTIGHAITTLTYPFVTPTTTLTLRNPDFGNKDRLSFNRINRETRGGTLIVFADPNWPKTQTLVLQISVLSSQQILDLKAFILASLGQQIGLLDHENRQWVGIITNPDEPLTQVGREDRSVTIQFQGVLA